MIVEFYQIGRQPNPIFEGLIKGDIVITGKGRKQDSRAVISVSGKTFELSDTLHRELVNNEKKTQVTDILFDGNKVGYIYPDIVAQKKFLCFSWGYDFLKMRLNDKEYQIYEVGLGPDQHYICIYENGITISIIHKKDMKINYRDNYTFYIEHDKDLIAVCVIALYFDCMRYPDHGEIAGGIIDNNSFITLQKELNDKYDPAFIPRIIALDKTYTFQIN